MMPVTFKPLDFAFPINALALKFSLSLAHRFLHFLDLFMSENLWLFRKLKMSIWTPGWPMFFICMFLAGVLPRYFSSEWSFARFRLPENTRCIVAFGSHNSIIVAGLDGRYVAMYTC